MPTQTASSKQSGFSLVELLIVFSVMLILAGAAVMLMKGSIMVSMSTYEMTDSQENLRTAQEYISRDLIVAGDGLRGFNNICVRKNFVTGFLTLNPNTSSCGTNMVNIPLVESDNNVPASTTVALTTPAVTVRSTPALTDRINILQIDTDFTPITLAATAIPANGSTIRVPLSDLPSFQAGEIYFIVSSVGATFGTITSIDNSTRKLSFATGDAYGLNNAAAGGPISTIAKAGTLPTSIRRMRIIHYYIDQNGLLVRRLFGVNGGLGHTDSVIAEHVAGLQFRYILDLPGIGGLYDQPVHQLSSPTEEAAVRQVEVTVTTETAHALANGSKQLTSMTSVTSVRNLQFIEALQP